jgi:hypothetical protein
MDRRRFLHSAALAGSALAAIRGVAWAEADGAASTKRFAEQRWVLDNIIRANGIDWDQPRSIYLSAPCGVEAGADFAAIRARRTAAARDLCRQPALGGQCAGRQSGPIPADAGGRLAAGAAQRQAAQERTLAGGVDGAGRQGCPVTAKRARDAWPRLQGTGNCRRNFGRILRSRELVCARRSGLRSNQPTQRSCLRN